jgi:hypothetical protein
MKMKRDNRKKLASVIAIALLMERDKLVMIGVMSDKTGEAKIRETITRVNERRFQALWEKESPDGKWIVFADEICTK